MPRMVRDWKARRWLAAPLGGIALGVFAFSPSVGPALIREAAAAPHTSSAPVRYRPVGCTRSGRQGDLVYRHGPRRRAVALTFDDGPFPITPRFVRMLKANHAVATFFVIGNQLTAAYRSTLREELRDGDALGDHSWSHPDLRYSADAYSQLLSTRQAIRRLTGYTPCLFRPPYGDYSGATVRIARSLGLTTILWDVDPADYTQPGVAAIERRVLAAAQRGSIILSHDGGGPRWQTLAAYPDIIRRLRARGYRFVTVAQLLGFHTVYRRCIRQCQAAAIHGHPPPGSIIQSG